MDHAGRLAILICEDIWHSILPSLCAAAGAQLILVPSASPGRGFSGNTVSNLDRYERLLTAVSEEHGVYCVNCHLCGFEGGKGFVGKRSAELVDRAAADQIRFAGKTMGETAGEGIEDPLALGDDFGADSITRQQDDTSIHAGPAFYQSPSGAFKFSNLYDF